MQGIRRNRITFFAAAFAVPFVAGLSLALWHKTSGELIMKIIGVLGVVIGVVQLTMRRVFEPGPGVPSAAFLREEHRALRHFRCLGVTSLLMGVAQFSPDVRVRTSLMACAVIPSLAAFFKVPKRMFKEE